MAEEGIRTAEELFEGILAGRVPRQVRLFAARGLLPVSRDQLIRLQLVLTTDSDPELAEVAEASIAELDEDSVTGWLSRGGASSPLELDLLARLREEESVWMAVAVQKNVSDETLRLLASHGGPAVQDVVITNQVRVMGCLEILDDLRKNASVSNVVLRRVKEFEEEFIAKAAAQAESDTEPEEAVGPTIGEALASLREIGAHLPKLQSLPLPKDEDPGVENAVKARDLSTFGKILRMTVREKVLCAMRGNREERGILINSRIPLVFRAVLSSPKITDKEIETFAASRSVSEDVVRIIAHHHKWLRHYSILLTVIKNPKAPVQQSIRLLSRLNVRDLGAVSRDRNTNPVVRKQAKMRFERIRR